MKLVVLGSGTTIPHPTRCSSGFWLETDGGSIMLDFSAAMTSRLAAEHLPWHELDAIWISHFHMDHCGGLGPFLAGTKHAPQMRSRQKPLTIFGPKGISELIEAFNAPYEYGLLEQPFPVVVTAVLPNEPFEILNGSEAVAYSTQHTEESLAIRIRDELGRTIVYSADTGFDSVLPTFANQADLFVLECTFLRNKPKIKHLELSEAVHMIRRSKCKRAMLTHFYPEWDGKNLDEEVRRIDEFLDVIEAVDGLRLDI